MEVKRDFYLDKLIERKHNGLVKVITGVRRCGKSYLLNTIFYNQLLSDGVAENHIIRFAFDSAEDLSSIGENLLEIEKQDRKVEPEKFMEFIRTKTVDSDMYYLLLDEVQLLGCFESVLNGYLRKSNIDVYVTGSNAKLLSRDIITEFAGRGDEVHMFPLSFAEFMSVYQGDKYEGLVQYMLYGGIPMVVLRQSEADKSAVLHRLFDEIYIRDIYRRHKVKGKGELEDLLNILSSSIGSLTNPEKLKNTFHTVKKSGITANTVRRYLEYLEDSFLVESAQRYDIKGKSYIETPRKYYFSDLGLRNARINFRQFEQTHTMENVIYNELVMRGFNVDVGVVPVAEKDAENKTVRKQLEVDFVCNMGSKRYYIQSAYSIPDEEKREQELRPFRRIEDSFKKIVVTKDITPAFYNDEGILTMNIYDFLLNPDSLEQ
ncbi:MAG: ATP-binding protein [Eubacteriales bacterium]|nr:ATP-binding protein [Eubacteriales bacterium]MDD3881120.1 ATP-binding protein [Eubacteriales bacterium]MDD4511502.1 ATP-binding protein [Eubacteriales bacterium]